MIILIDVLALLCVALFVVFITFKAGHIQVPFFVGCIYLGWLLPQFYAYYASAPYDHHLLTRPVVFSAVSLMMLTAGWFYGCARGKRAVLAMRAKKARLSHRQFITDTPGQFRTDTTVSLIPLFLLTVFGWAVTLAILNLPADMLSARMPTGLVTILRFLSSTRAVSLPLALILFLHRPSWPLALLVVLNLALYAPSIFVQIKRNDLIEVAAIILSCLWFMRRATPSRAVVIGGLIGAFVLVASVSQLRNISGFETNALGDSEIDLPTIAELEQIDFGEAVSEVFSIRYIEVQNASHYMVYIENNGHWSFGGQLWNRIVNLYVPGQIVGSEFKKSLIIGFELYDFEFSKSFYERLPGSTLTGFLQGFTDFWYFGVTIYLFAGVFAGRLFISALDRNLFSQIAYSSLIIPIITSFTHDTYMFITNSIFYIPLCLVSAYLTMRIGARRRRSRALYVTGAAI